MSGQFVKIEKGLGPQGRIAVFEVALGQNEAQGRGGGPHQSSGLLPVMPFGGELITSHHGPLGHVRTGGGEQDLGDPNAQPGEAFVGCQQGHIPSHSSWQNPS